MQFHGRNFSKISFDTIPKHIACATLSSNHATPPPPSPTRSHIIPRTIARTVHGKFCILATFQVRPTPSDGHGRGTRAVWRTKKKKKCWSKNAGDREIVIRQTPFPLVQEEAAARGAAAAAVRYRGASASLPGPCPAAERVNISVVLHFIQVAAER